MIVSFHRWMENKSLSPPQHRVEEIDKDLDEVVGRRLMELAMEMENKGTASRQKVLDSIQRVIGTVPRPQQQEPTSQEQPPQQQISQEQPQQNQLK